VTFEEEMNVAKEEVEIGVAEKRLSDPKDPLIGKWFIVWGQDGRSWEHQGVVTGKIADGVYLVKLFERSFLGSANTLFCVNLSAMVTSDFTGKEGLFEFFENEEHLRNCCEPPPWLFDPPDDGGIEESWRRRSRTSGASLTRGASPSGR